MNLSTARIFVRDLAAADAFYTQKLGLSRQAGRPDAGFCVFGTGACQLVVESVPAGAPEDEQALIGRFTGLSFSVPDILAKHRELAERGVEFSGEPELQFWGGTLATLRDPAGNELQFVQMPNVA